MEDLFHHVRRRGPRGRLTSSPAPAEDIALPDDPESPCTSLCELDADTGWCRGCGRDIDEIIDWGAATALQKSAIIAALPARLAQLRLLGADPDQPR